MDKICKHCKEIFDTENKPKGWMANHSRWCKENPKRKDYEDSLILARKSLNDNFEILIARNEKIKNAWKEGRYQNADLGSGFRGKTHTEESKEKISKKALESKHRRLRKNSINYRGILLDSNWELELAKRLDSIGIEWTRPEPLKWTDKNGISRNYFPDFYLPEYNLFLDPKNPEAMRRQSSKISILNEIYSNIIWIKTLDECKNFKI
jgi:hypothetical protein